MPNEASPKSIAPFYIFAPAFVPAHLGAYPYSGLQPQTQAAYWRTRWVWLAVGPEPTKKQWLHHLNISICVL